MPADDPERDDAVGRWLALGARATTSHLASILPGGGLVAAFATELTLDRLQRQVDELERALKQAAAHRALVEAEILDLIRERAELRALVLAFMESNPTDDEHHRRLAGRVLEDGLGDDAMVDEARFLLNTLRSLEPAHLRILNLLAGWTMHVPATGEDTPWPMTREEIADAWPESRSVLSPLLATLEGAGLATQDMVSPDRVLHPERYEKAPGQKLPATLPTDLVDAHRITRYGRRLIAYATSP